MPKITVRADRSGEPGQMTLSERIVATHLNDDHYAAQLIERLAWAAADAEALEEQASAAEASGGAAASRGRGVGHEGSRPTREAREPVNRSIEDAAVPVQAEPSRRRVLASSLRVPTMNVLKSRPFAIALVLAVTIGAALLAPGPAQSAGRTECPSARTGYLNGLDPRGLNQVLGPLELTFARYEALYARRMC